MANITTFGTLKSEILALIGRAPADFVYQIVTQEINRDLRLLEMQSTSTKAEAASITLPTDFIEMEAVYRDKDPRTILAPTTVDMIHRDYETTGTPTHYAIADGVMLLNKPGSASNNLELRYYAELALLSANDDTNEVLTEYPGIYLYGALFHHAMGVGDPRQDPWGAAYNRAKMLAQQSDTKARMAGTASQPRVRGMTP